MGATVAVGVVETAEATAEVDTIISKHNAISGAVGTAPFALLRFARPPTAR